jgi:hypothetical protein
MMNRNSPVSLTFASQLTAIATLALAILALIFAGFAFRKQSREVRDQAEMLKVQSEQLAEDRKVNAEQIRVLGLQAEELGQVAADRGREALEKVRAQANQISAWTWSDPPNSWFEVVNRSDLQVYQLVILTDSADIERPANLNVNIQVLQGWAGLWFAGDP